MEENVTPETKPLFHYFETGKNKPEMAKIMVVCELQKCPKLLTQNFQHCSKIDVFFTFFLCENKKFVFVREMVKIVDIFSLMAGNSRTTCGIKLCNISFESPNQ